MLERIGNCRIVEEVASGGMAVVYRAIQDHLNRTVAIKALKTSVSADKQLVTRFEREAQALANLQHENLIQVYDYHEERGALFIVMEYLQGIDLYDLLDHCGRLPYDVAAVIAMQVARALDYIHYRGIVHRDIKPANIMLSRHGGVKVMDFGIAHDRNFADLTEAGTGIGTPAYMSPEQILGDKLDARSDIFSLGVVLYQMMTGRKPFIEDHEKSVMHKIRLDKHERARKHNPEIPRALERIVDKCLRKLPRERWRSAQALVMALERFLAKHVEMNYHARLVLFLKNQDIITQLEAEEYLNPALSGPAPTPRAMAANAALRVIRETSLVQTIILALTALIVTLIHLVPVGATRDQSIAAATTMSLPLGYVRVVAHPWGRIFIDNREVGVTPEAEPFEVTAGKHTIRVEHYHYQPAETTVEVAEGSKKSPAVVVVDFEASGTPKEMTLEDTD